MKTSHPVDIWTICLDNPLPGVLSTAEIARAARFHFERDRLHWTAARSALRTVLAKYLDLDPKHLEFSLGPHGKPALAVGPEFNLSHSHGWAMIAVSEGIPVGIDLEEVRENVPIAKLLTRAGEDQLPSGISALFQRWTDREARTKAAGIPLLEKPADSVIAIPLRAPAGFTASVALVGAAPEPRYSGSL